MDPWHKCQINSITVGAKFQITISFVMKSTDSDDLFDHRQSPLDCCISDGHGIVNQSNAEFLTVDFVGTPMKISRKSDKRPSKINSKCTSDIVSQFELRNRLYPTRSIWHVQRELRHLVRIPVIKLHLLHQAMRERPKARYYFGSSDIFCRYTHFL